VLGEDAPVPPVPQAARPDQQQGGGK